MALDAGAQQLTIPLWRKVPSGSDGWTNKESFIVNRNGDRIFRNVVEPDLLTFVPEKGVANGTAVIIAPGGGFRILSYDNEGTWIAEWFQKRGVAAFVLKYRLQNIPAPVPGSLRPPPLPGTFAEALAASPELTAASHLAIEDGKQAMRIVRQRAQEFNISPDKIGMIGFSAGGLVALHTALVEDNSARPDFLGLIYTSTSEFKISHGAPPMFAVVAADDKVVGNGTLLEFQTWQAAGLPTELHIYEKGGHGFGMAKQNLPADSWIERLADWLTSMGYLPKTTK